MLDSLKGLAGSGKAQKQVDDLQSLITAAKEERSALSAMLTQISMRSSKLLADGKVARADRAEGRVGRRQAR